MDKDSQIIVTGAAGFIASCLVGFLNKAGYENLILVDDFTNEKKKQNLAGKKFKEKVERENFFEWLKSKNPKINFFYHIGARTDTTEFDYSVHEHLNVDYSKKVWNYCSEKNVPLVYASSAATYGAGEFGYKDDELIIEKLKPLNPYGVSKNEFDKWALKQRGNHPPAWAGLKFFNVYGPNEYHKARMASVIFHSYNQIVEKGFVKLFKSHKKEYKDGKQLRDVSGIYNVGTGKARSFDDLVKATFSGLDKTDNIKYIDMPDDIREKYQYYTEADMNKIHAAGYTSPFYSLEEGVEDYVKNYLSKDRFY